VIVSVTESSQVCSVSLSVVASSGELLSLHILNCIVAFSGVLSKDLSIGVFVMIWYVANGYAVSSGAGKGKSPVTPAWSPELSKLVCIAVMRFIVLHHIL
jgi:hypothetical protein